MAKRISGNVVVDVTFKDGFYSGKVAVKHDDTVRPVFRFDNFVAPADKKLSRKPSGSEAYDRVAEGAIKRAKREMIKQGRINPVFFAPVPLNDGFELTRAK